MTPLTIIPNYEKKRLKCYGTVAAGEHVLVTVTGGNDWVAPDGENQTLRLRLLFGPHTVGVFPFVTEEMSEDDPETFPTPDAWDTTGDDPTCDLNLNTIQAAKFLKFGGNCLFVLDDPTNDILYATGEFEVLKWPKCRGADLPYDLDGYPDFVFDAKNAMAEAAETAQNAANAASAAEATATRLEQDVYGHRQAAETAATNAQNSANGASNSKQDAEAWAVGERGGAAVGTDDETYHNNAKYYAEQAGDAKTDAAASATSAATSATVAAGSATSAAGSATAAASSAQSAAGAAEAAVETEKERAEGAESDLADAIDAEKKRAEGAEALAIVNAEYNDTSRLIVFTMGGGETKTIDASAFIKDGMISSVAVSNGNLVITFNSDAGKQPISIPLTQIFNPSNYYDKTAADGTFVKKDGSKGLSTNDYTAAEKQKLSGIASNANNYVLPPATAATLGGVKQGTGCEIAADGTLNVTGGGGTVDNTVTQSSANPVKSSGIWGAIWGTLTALPTGFTALYDWVVAQLAGKLSTSGGTMTGRISALLAPLKLNTDTTFARFTIPGATNEHYMCFGYKDDNFGLFVKNGSGSAERFYALPSSGGDIAMIQDLAGKASAADLRYRIAEAGFEHQFAASAFPITYMNTITSTPVTITEGDAGDITWDVQLDGSAYVLYNGFDFAYFNSTGDYGGSQPGVDLQFNGVAAEDAGKPLVQTVADRTMNLITATDETSIDVELPAAVTVDGVRYCRDFLLDVDNSANASDLALEFTGLGVDYGFVTDADDDIGEMMTIAGYGTGSSGDGARVRLYFTECAVEGGSGQALFHVARVTLSADIDSTTQGGNS